MKVSFSFCFIAEPDQTRPKKYEDDQPLEESLSADGSPENYHYHKNNQNLSWFSNMEDVKDDDVSISLNDTTNDGPAHQLQLEDDKDQQNWENEGALISGNISFSYLSH